MHEGFGPAVLPRFSAEIPGGASGRALANGRAELAKILAGEVLPRLLGRGRVARSGADPDVLARRLLAGRFEEARAGLMARRASGAPASSVLLGDIAPAARRLGALWADDACDFFDVTRAAGGLADLLREIGHEEDVAAAADAPAIVVSLAPGETHALGAEIVAWIFRGAGWRIALCAADELCGALAGAWFDVVGFSLGCDRHVGALPAAIAAAREASRNARLAVLVGGAALAAAPGLGAGLDAEFCVRERDIAVHFPHGLLRALRL